METMMNTDVQMNTDVDQDRKEGNEDKYEFILDAIPYFWLSEWSKAVLVNKRLNKRRNKSTEMKFGI